MGTNNEEIKIKLPEKLKEQFKLLCELDNKTMSNMVKEFITTTLSKDERFTKTNALMCKTTFESLGITNVRIVTYPFWYIDKTTKEIIEEDNGNSKAMIIGAMKILDLYSWLKEREKVGQIVYILLQDSNIFNDNNIIRVATY